MRNGRITGLREVMGEGRTCLLAASAGWPAKCWAVEKYGALAVELKAMGMDVVVNAPREDDADGGSSGEGEWRSGASCRLQCDWIDRVDATNDRAGGR